MTSTLRQRGALPVEVLPKQGSPAPSSDGSEDLGLDYSSLDEGLPTFTPPTYTVKELLGAIPAHCFQRSALRSGSYILFDFAVIGMWSYLATFIDPSFGKQGNVLQGFAGEVAKWTAWSAYWLVVGWSWTGLWIIAHECGHQAFSESKTVNNSVGLVLHSMLLVPFHSWRISHAAHHAHTSDIDHDQVFIPKSAAQRGVKKGSSFKKKWIDGKELDELLEDAPMYRLFFLTMQQVFGWPLYLIFNVSGQKKYPAWTNHFNPEAIIFNDRQRMQIVISDLGLLAMGAAMTVFSRTFGFAALVKYYLIPYLWVNHNLVWITFLQHTDETLPHYRGSAWTFPRGALCTVDRNFLGPVGPYLLHGICETHISHHIASRMPHYHAWEATEALKGFLGEHYRYSDENMVVSLWKQYNKCRFVDTEGDVVFYRDAYGRAARTPVLNGAVSDSGIEVE